MYKYNDRDKKPSGKKRVVILGSLAICVVAALVAALMAHNNQITQQTGAQNQADLAACLSAAQPQYSQEDLTTLALYQPASYSAVLQAQQKADAACQNEYPRKLTHKSDDINTTLELKPQTQSNGQ